jgi:hypothetical protein
MPSHRPPDRLGAEARPEPPLSSMDCSIPRANPFPSKLPLHSGTKGPDSAALSGGVERHA